MTSARRRLVAISDGNRIAGAERQLGVLLEHLDPSVEVTVLGPHRATIDWIASQRGGATAVVSPPLATTDDLHNLRAVRQLVTGTGASVVHLNKTEVAGLRYVEAVARTIPGCRVISAVHHIERPATIGDRLMARALARRAPAIVAVSRALARQLELVLKLAEGTVTAIPNGLPPLAIERQLGGADRGPDDELVVGSLGRHAAHKALDDLISAVARTKHIRLLLGGDGPERRRLEELARRLGVAERVTFLGWVEPGEVLEHCHVLASSSRIDGHPLTLLDARNAGLPIVATDVGGVSDIVEHRHTGLLVPPGDPEAMAAALHRLRVAPDLLVSMEAASLATAAAPGRNDGPEHMAEQYHRLYWPPPASDSPRARRAAGAQPSSG